MMDRHAFNFSFQVDCFSDNEEKYGDTLKAYQKVEEKFKLNIKNESLDSADQKLETKEALDIKQQNELKAASIQTIDQNQERLFRRMSRGRNVQNKVTITKSKKNGKRRTLSRSHLKLKNAKVKVVPCIDQNQEHPNVQNKVPIKKSKKNVKKMTSSSQIKLKNAKAKVVPCLFCNRVFYTKTGLSKHLSTVTSVHLPHPSEAEMEEAKLRGFYKFNACNSKLPLIIGGDKMGQHIKRCRSEHVGNILPKDHSKRHQYHMSELLAPISQPTFPFLQPLAPFQQFPLNYLNDSESQFTLSADAQSMRKSFKFDLDPIQRLGHNNQNTSLNNNKIGDELLQMERMRQKQVDKIKAEEENMRKINTMIALKRKEQYFIEGKRVACCPRDLRGEQKQLMLDKREIERERKELDLERKIFEDQRKIQELHQSIMDQVVKINPGYHGRSVKERLEPIYVSRGETSERSDNHVLGSRGKIDGGVVNTVLRKKRRRIE